MNKKSKHKLKYLGNKKSFWNKTKSIFILSKGLLVSKTCFRSESVPLNNYEKYFQFSLKKSFFCSRDIKVFVLPTSPQFFPVSPCLRGWFKINIKVYDTSICRNKNLITYFVWYLEKEKRYDIETLSNDRVLRKEHFHGKIMQKLCTESQFKTFFNFGK